MSKIYFQGTFGAYSHLAALSIEPKAEIIPCKTFDECFNKASLEAECKIIIPIYPTRHIISINHFIKNKCGFHLFRFRYHLSMYNL